MKKVQIALLGGFLGAGKTTTMIQTAKLLQDKGNRVAIVTNDQGKELIDTELALTNGLYAKEVTGGCFCCRFEDLYEHLNQLSLEKQPDYIICEAVGSCTDLAATVIRPLQSYYAEEFKTVPLTIVVDPARLLNELGEDPDRIVFSNTVSYIFEKQLCEADIIALNKVDQYSDEELEKVVMYLSQRYPHAVVQTISAEKGTHLDKLVELWDQSSESGLKVLDIDYGLYADGEAQLAWMNILGDLKHPERLEFDPQQWVDQFLGRLNEHFVREKMAVAHLKVHVGNDKGYVKASIVQTGVKPVYTSSGSTAGSEYRVVINIRIEASPALLDLAVADSIASVNERFGTQWGQSYHECFSPLPPNPTHRLQVTV
jgi:G3E family GTPase